MRTNCCLGKVDDVGIGPWLGPGGVDVPPRAGSRRRRFRGNFFDDNLDTRFDTRTIKPIGNVGHTDKTVLCLKLPTKKVTCHPPAPEPGIKFKAEEAEALVGGDGPTHILLLVINSGPSVADSRAEESLCGTCTPT
jgi:hypothetical protein